MVNSSHLDAEPALKDILIEADTAEWEAHKRNRREASLSEHYSLTEDHLIKNLQAKDDRTRIVRTLARSLNANPSFILSCSQPSIIYFQRQCETETITVGHFSFLILAS
jgi:hypothetical protein